MSPSGFTGSLLSVLRPLLTPVPARQPFLATAPTAAGGIGRQVSLSKNVNSCCTTGPFISGAEHWAALCRASSPAPSTCYGLSVRRLISFDRWLPSHETSQFRSCFGLVLWAKLSPVMRASLTAFPYRGLSPHQFTPMSGAHNFMEANCRDMNTPVASNQLGHAANDQAFCSAAVDHFNRWSTQKW